MSDLQCPATILLLTPETVVDSDTAELRLSLVVCDACISAGSRAGAAVASLAAAHDCQIELADIADRAKLTERIEQLADAYRGEQVAVVAGQRAVCDALYRASVPTEPITLAVDSGGWNIVSR